MKNIKDLVNSKENKSFVFKPNAEFYQQIDIRRRRWGQIYRGEVSPTIDELKSIASYFNVSVNELI